MKAQVLLSLLLATGAPSVQAEKLDFVPRQFQGTWALRRDQCDRPAATMVIRAKSVVLSGHEGRIQVVIAHGRFEMAFVAEIPEGRPVRLRARSFELSADGMQLTDTTHEGSRVWAKCP